MYKYKGTKDSGSKSWLLQRISGLALVVFMIGHYVLMHYTPESGHTYDAVLGRMQYSWYRIIDITFVTLAMYHGLNGVWGIFRDYNLKTWQNYAIVTALIVFGIAFVAWGYVIIFSIPYINDVAGVIP